jgi:hypothetical protein
VVRCQEAEVSSLTRSNDLLLMEAETRRQTRVQRADQMEGVRGHVDKMARRLQFMQITTADIEESKVNWILPRPYRTGTQQYSCTNIFFTEHCY